MFHFLPSRERRTVAFRMDQGEYFKMEQSTEISESIVSLVRNRNSAQLMEKATE